MKASGREKTQVVAEFKDFYGTVLNKDAPLLTDLLGTHREVVTSIIDHFKDCLNAEAAKHQLSQKELSMLYDLLILGAPIESEDALQALMAHPAQTAALLRERLTAHASIMCGPWPVILTTNWDSCLAASW